MRELTRRIHRDFAYDRDATTVATPVADVLRDAPRRLPGLRAPRDRLPARARARRALRERLHPDDPAAPAKPRLVGADASHAWLAVWLGEAGWVDVDPTNDQLPSDQHVTLAWGRDYGDVSPMHGVILGGGAHRMTVAVDVTPVD